MPGVLQPVLDVCLGDRPVADNEQILGILIFRGFGERKRTGEPPCGRLPESGRAGSLAIRFLKNRHF